MSLAAASPHQLPTGSAGSCPPSPPPAISVTSAFFQSPFSNRNTPSQQTPRNVPPNFCGSLSPSIMCVGLKYQRLISKEEDENKDHHSSYALSWKQPVTRLSSDWTPLSSRSSPCNNQLRSPDRRPASTEDRLDRLLAEMGSGSPPKSIVSSNTSVTKPIPVECWELSCLETRFHPAHTSFTVTTLRPCLKNLSTSISSASSTESSETDDPLPDICSMSEDVDQNLDDRSVKVRFDDNRIEEFFTWSRESYDRKGPQPITKLNIREILELKLIKEELGISSPSKSSFTPEAC